MIIVMKPGTSKKNLKEVIDRIEELGYTVRHATSSGLSVMREGRPDFSTLRRWPVLRELSLFSGPTSWRVSK